MKSLLKNHKRKFAIKRLALKLSVTAVFITSFIIGNQAIALNEWNTQELRKIEAPTHYSIAIKAQKSIVSHYSNDYKELAIQLPNRVVRCDITN